ncbi:MAG: cytochrome C oxidase subunit IV [Gammaproteobacteria bacterium]|nr:MAG: cytochrome C oxidase subunit IV [Gammaproteobacteria bacterium]
MAEHTAGQQQHPIKIYLIIWGMLFVLSAFSYAVDYFGLEGMLRWTLILTFMFLKAGFIVAIFMHMAWERLALIGAILLPPAVLLVLIGLMAVEGDYTTSTRAAYFDEKPKLLEPAHSQENR